MAEEKVIEPQVSDEAVLAATGKRWAEWLELLDAAGGREMTHKELVKVAADEGASAWWQQNVAVTYEQARGLRAKHQQGDTFQVSRSKTVGVPVAELFELWANDDRRAAWLDQPVEIRKATPGKSLRITWLADDTSVDVYLSVKGDARSAVSVQHSKLPDAERAQELKEYWGETLNRLKEVAEHRAD